MVADGRQSQYEAKYSAASERPRSAPAPSRPLRQASRRRAVALPRGAVGDAVAGIAAWRHPDNSSSGCRIPAAAAVRRQAGRPDLAAGRQFFCNERNPSAALQAPLPPTPPYPASPAPAGAFAALCSGLRQTGGALEVRSHAPRRPSLDGRRRRGVAVAAGTGEAVAPCSPLVQPAAEQAGESPRGRRLLFGPHVAVLESQVGVLALAAPGCGKRVARAAVKADLHVQPGLLRDLLFCHVCNRHRRSPLPPHAPRI